MALAQQMDVAQWVEAFGGGHRHVLDYLMQEVLERQPAPVRDFVVQTAILDRLTAPLCDAVTGRQDGREMLDRLERNSLFVVPLDDRRTWYRYHQIFADALRGQMQPSQRMALYARAARWCEAQGLLPEAIAYALSALDWPLAAQLIERSGVDMLQRLERATVLGWLRILPQSLVRSRPKLCLIHAWAMLYTAQFSEAEIWATHAEAALAESAGPGAAPAAPDPAPLLGEVDALRATVAVNRGQFSLAIELSQRALLRLPPDQALGRILVHLDLGDAFSVSDDYAAAHQAMAEALHIAEGVANLDLMVVILGSQGALYLRQGQLHRAATVLQRALALDASWRRGVGRPLFALGKPLIFLAAVQYEWNELDTALDTVRQGIELCRQWGHSAHLVDGLFQLAEVWQALGDLQAAQEALREAERHLQAAAGGADTALLSDSLAAEPRMRGLGNRQALLLLREGKLDEVGAWERQTDAQRLLGGAARSQTDFYACIVLARLFLARGDAERASELLRSLDELAQAKGWLNRRIGVLVLRALADEARALSDSALAHLTLALQLGQAEGYVRAFLDQGPAVAPLLARAAQRGIAPSYSSRLLAAFAPNLVLAEAASSAAAAPRAAHSPLAEPLSEREIEILRLVAQGLANQQIADRLFITLGTTKWHLNNIYGKLGVASRTQAVALARQLKII